jgi:hypothetical protein
MSSKYRNITLASSAAVKSGPGSVATLNLTAGADTATVILYDNTAGSGTVICKRSAVANTSAPEATLHVPFSIGCYAAITGTAPSVTVTFW